MGLLDLPDEVLDATFKYLLPSFRSQSLAETYVFTVPVDLLAARLVSRRLHRIATPYAWRRAQLQIASPVTMGYRVRYTYPGPDAPRPLARCRFFTDHPELAAHVRVLLISLEWSGECPKPARDALRAATDAMYNLRTLFVWDADVLAAEDIRQLLQRPLLRAVCLMDVDGSAFPAQCDWGKGLTMMHVANAVCPARLVAPALECLSLELTRAGPGVRELPWGTLREVALVDCVDEGDWTSFLAGFELHKRLGRPAALTELMVGDLAGLGHTRVSQLLHTFGGHPLARLTLYHVMTLDPPTLARIVHAFPALRHLTLLTDGELRPWSGALDEYAQALARLPGLRTLEWNNFLLGPAMDAAFLTLGEAALGKLYVKHVRALVRRVRGLRCVKLASVTDCVVDSVYVKDGADADGLIEVRRTTEAALHTSSWSTSSDAFQDI